MPESPLTRLLVDLDGIQGQFDQQWHAIVDSPQPPSQEQPELEEAPIPLWRKLQMDRHGTHADAPELCSGEFQVCFRFTHSQAVVYTKENVKDICITISQIRLSWSHCIKYLICIKNTIETHKVNTTLDSTLSDTFPQILTTCTATATECRYSLIIWLKNDPARDNYHTGV